MINSQVHFASENRSFQGFLAFQPWPVLGCIWYTKTGCAPNIYNGVKLYYNIHSIQKQELYETCLCIGLSSVAHRTYVMVSDLKPEVTEK